MNQFYTAESVTEGHPDKLCDIIADSVLDECLAHDALSRVACEVLATKGQVIVAGEITSLFEPDIPSIVHSVFRKAGYDPARFSVQCLLHRQSPDIAAGVDCSLERRRNSLGRSARPCSWGPGIRASWWGTPVRKPRRGCLCRWCWPTVSPAPSPPPGKPGWCGACARTGKRRSPWNTARMASPCGWIPLCCLPSTARISPWTNSAGNSPIRCWPRRCRLYPRTRIRKSF